MLKGRIIYAAIIVAAFIFSQALYDSISLFTLICVLLLPVLSLLMLLLCRSTVSIRTKLVRSQVYRYQSTKLLVEIRSGAPFLSPLIRLRCVLNDPDGKESVIRCLPAAFAPMSKTVIEIPVMYTFRGVYEVGVRQVEIYDFLGLFKIKQRVGDNYKLYVTPRFLPLDMNVSQNIFLEEGSSTSMVASSGYNAELFGVRDYNENDSLRHVHWNLSAAKEELVVKTYSVNQQKQIYLLLDLTDKQPDTLYARRLGDAIMETGLSLCRNLLSQVGAVCLMWQHGNLNECLVDNFQRLSVAYEEVGLCPMQTEKTWDQTVGQLGGVQDLCIVTGRLDEEKLARVELLQNMLHCPVRLFALANICDVQKSSLAAKNITLEIISLEEIEKGRVTG